jgi:hypothetical protein
MRREFLWCRASGARVNSPLSRRVHRRPKHCAKARFVVSTTTAKGNN